MTGPIFVDTNILVYAREREEPVGVFRRTGCIVFRIHVADRESAMSA